MHCEPRVAGEDTLGIVIPWIFAACFLDAVASKCAGNGTGNNACKHLLSVPSSMDSGVVGEGTIDGRGGEALTGGTKT